jgi:hypothetical protein
MDAGLRQFVIHAFEPDVPLENHFALDALMKMRAREVRAEKKGRTPFAINTDLGRHVFRNVQRLSGRAICWDKKYCTATAGVSSCKNLPRCTSL